MEYETLGYYKTRMNYRNNAAWTPQCFPEDDPALLPVEVAYKSGGALEAEVLGMFSKYATLMVHISDLLEKIMSNVCHCCSVA